MEARVSRWRGAASPPEGRGPKWVGPLALGLACLLAAGCARVGVQEGLGKPAGPGVQEVALEAVSFGFIPNRIRVRAGDEIRLRVRNTSRIGHNLTILRPNGRKAKSVDLPARETVEVSFRARRRGRYAIYCDRFLHQPLGMEGVIDAR